MPDRASEAIILNGGLVDTKRLSTNNLTVLVGRPILAAAAFQAAGQSGKPVRRQDCRRIDKSGPTAAPAEIGGPVGALEPLRLDMVGAGSADSVQFRGWIEVQVCLPHVPGNVIWPFLAITTHTIPLYTPTAHIVATPDAVRKLNEVTTHA